MVMTLMPMKIIILISLDVDYPCFTVRKFNEVTVLEIFSEVCFVQRFLSLKDSLLHLEENFYRLVDR